MTTLKSLSCFGWHRQCYSSRAQTSHLAVLNQRILFVDDDLAFLETIERTFRAWNNGTVAVALAHSAGQAIAQLQAHDVTLAVIDIRMPVVDGIQFLHLLHRKHPNTRKIVLTGYADPEFRSACMRGGAELFLEKPRTAADFDSVFASISELLRVPVDEGFTGTLKQVGIHEVLQLECLSRRSSILEVVSSTTSGKIYITEGVICHAETTVLSGQDAFYYLVSLRSGVFQFSKFEEPAQRTITGPWEFLLMESTRLRDERPEGESDFSTGESNQSLIGELPVSAFSPMMGSLPAVRTLAPAPAPAPKPAPTVRDIRDVRDLRPVVAAPQESLAQARMQDVQLPVVEECVLTNTDGGVEASWRSADPDLRANLVEFLRFKSRQICHGLAMGEFRRMEAHTTRETIVAEPRRGGGLYARGRGAGADAAALITAGNACLEQENLEK